MFDTAGARCVLAIVLVALVCRAAGAENLPALLDEREQAAVAHALRCLKMTPADLGYKKDHSDAPYRLDKVQRFLERPLELPRHAGTVLRSLATLRDMRELAAFARREQERAEPGNIPMDFGSRYVVPTEAEQQIPEPLRDTFHRALPCISLASDYLAEALAPVTESEMRQALARYVTAHFYLERDDAEIAALRTLGLDETQIREMLLRDQMLETEDDEYARDLLLVCQKLDLARLNKAAEALAFAVNDMVGSLTNADVRAAIAPDARLRIETRHGLIFIGGAGPTHYTEDALLIIDLGGDDTYDCHAGAANGLANRPISLVIDLAGNDIYRSGSLAQGAGVFGIGILVDCGGNDSYSGDIHAQGAGMFGVGILWDRDGDDRYFARQSSQGFGYTGGLGLLLDAKGHDTYYAGGKYADHERLPERYLSTSQGFATGMRPDASGGVGILCDLAGNDIYTCDIYGQGVGYFYSLGLLLDAEGHDVYRCHQYGQGAGIHLAAGILADWQGDDQYLGHNIVQGAAHDWSVGMLFDKQGNDQYAANSTAHGSALYNSVALLVDSAGNDLYASPAGSNTQAAGHDGDRREYGSIALLLDLEGADTYTNGPRDEFIALKPHHGCALDSEKEQMAQWGDGAVGREPGDRPPSSFLLPPSSFASTPTELARPRDDRERRWLRLIRQAAQYADNEKKARDKALAYELLRREGSAVLPFWLRQLDHDTLMIRVRLDEFLDEVGGTNAAPALLEALQSRNERIRRSACYYAGKLKVDGAVELLETQLPNDKVRPIALWALGELRAPTVIEHAPKYLRDPSESVRIRATGALGKLGDPRATPGLIEALHDDLWSVRYSAQTALVRIGKSSLRPMLRALPQASDRGRPHLIEALGRVGDWRTANALRPYLRSEDWLTRGVTVAAISQLNPGWWERERRRLWIAETNLFVRSRLESP